MGNSEVGHMTLRRWPRGVPKFHAYYKAISDGDFLPTRLLRRRR